jgi:hypothetical protein
VPRSRQTVEFSCDTDRTQDRIRRLQQYMNSNVLRDHTFVCASWGECEASISPGCTFVEGQLSHVGKHYDMLISGTSVRVVIVGQEVGGRGHPRTTLRERYQDIYEGSGLGRGFVSDGLRKRRNPHMRGTTLALRAVFGLPDSSAHESEFLGMDNSKVHLFDCFALVNRLLCSSHVARTSTGRPSRTMFDNCQRHFLATLEILQPTIVIVQGVKVWRQTQAALVAKRQVSEHLVESDVGGQPVLVATFTHPSARAEHRWDSTNSAYMTKVVRPTLDAARRIAIRSGSIPPTRRRGIGVASC